MSRNRSLSVLRISKLSLLGFFLSVFLPISGVTEKAEAAPNNKATICHRTKSVKNPYRLITISRGAINSGHGKHKTTPTSGVWTTSKVQGDNWEDIIPDVLNWSTAGAQDIYYGRTRTNSGTPACRSMTFSQFYKSEKAAGSTDAQIAADLDDGMSDEDKAVLKTFGGSGCNTFASCSTPLSTIAANSSAIVAVTTFPTSVSGTAATLNGYVRTDSNSIRYYFEYSTDGTWVTEPTKVPATSAGPLATNTTTAVNFALTGLTSGTTYYYRIVAEYTIAGVLQQVTGDLVSFEATSSPRYVVKYDANGGTEGLPAVDTRRYPANTGTKVLDNYGNLAKNGAAFIGWSLSPGAQLKAGAPQLVTSINFASTEPSKFYSKFARMTFLKVTPVPQRTSGTLVGGNDITVQTSDITLYAQYATGFNVTYNGNTAGSGTVPTDGTSYANGATVTVLGNSGTLAKSGYSFGGWCTTQPDPGSACGGTTRAASSTFTISSSVTLYAIWTPNKYSYSGNGGSGSAPADQVFSGSTINAAANTFSLNSYSFYGWCLTQHSAGVSCSGTRYLPGNPLPNPETSTVTLYAIWSNATLYTVTYDSQGGSNVDPATYASGDSLTLASAPTRTGYTFNGWFENSTGGSALSSPYTPSPAGNKTLYAQWTIRQFTVDYHGNSNTGGTDPASVTKNYNETATVSAAGSLVRTGYSFGGWNLNSDGSGVTTYQSGDTLTVTSNITLYAVWTAGSYQVSYNGNSNDGGSVPANQSKIHDTNLILASNSGSLTRSGFTFNGWNTAANGSGTAYAAGATYSLNTAVVLYAQWNQVSSGGGGGGSPAPEPIVIPKPVINSLSRSLVCTTGLQINVLGSGLSGAVAKLDGVEVPVVSNNGAVAAVRLPAGLAGKKTLQLTTSAGSASIDLTYQKFENPKFTQTYVPYLYQGGVFALMYSASDTNSYRLVGNLPEGLAFNTVTGSISGSPLVEGVFSFSMFAVGDCGETEEKITLDIDKAVPKAISHRIYFSRNNAVMPPSVKENLERFLNKVQNMSPRYITPQIYITTNTEPNGEENKAIQLERDRYQAICEGLIGENISAEIVLDVFSGDDNMIEIIAYWPNPS